MLESLKKQVYEAKQYLLRLVPAVLAANLMYFGVLVSADLADVVLLFDGHHKYGAIAHFVILQTFCVLRGRGGVVIALFVLCTLLSL